MWGGLRYDASMAAILGVASNLFNDVSRQRKVNGTVRRVRLGQPKDDK
jgi:hypothetical protein